MKYLIFSDIHLANWQGCSFDNPERISQRLLEQKSILQQLIDLSIENDAILLNGGDIFHNVGKVPTEALIVYSWFVNECKNCGITYLSVVGNHDLSIRQNATKYHNVLNLFQEKEERDKALSVMNPTIKFVDYDNEDAEIIKGYDIVILHKQPSITNKYGHEMDGVNWKKIEKNNKFCFYGHDHTTRKLSKFSYVIGSPMQLNFADAGQDRGCWLVDSEDWSVKFIKLNYTELVKIEEKEEATEEPKFEERIKSSSFQGILIEWLDLQQKPRNYLETIQKDITDKLQIVKTFFTGKITTLKVINLLSIEELFVEFKNGFHLIIGKNGSGKSSIFEALLWVLFDETTKGLAKTDVIRNRPKQQKDGIVELHLKDDKHNYTIVRSVKNGLEIFQDEIFLTQGMTKLQAQEFLEKNVLGFDKTTYIASCYFSQEQLTMLSNLGDTEKTSMITNLLGFEVYDDLYDLMDKRIKEITLQLEEIEKGSVKLDNELWKNHEQQENLKEQIEMFTKSQCSLKDEQSKVTIQIGELTTLLGNIVVPSVTTDEIDDSLLILNSSKTEMSTKLRKLQETGHLIIQEQNKIDKEKTKLEFTIRTSEKEITIINEYLKVLLNNPDKLCPTCGAKMDDEHWASELAIKTSQRDNLVASQPLMPPDFESKLNELYDKEAENKELIDETNAEIIKIEQKIKEVQEQRNTTLKTQVEANTRKENLTSQLKQLEQRNLALVKQIAEVNIDTKQEQLTNLKITFDCVDAKKLELNNDRLKLIENQAIYEFWKNAFSNKGIRPLLLDKFCNTFNSIVKPYCQQVSKGQFNIEFTPTSETRKGEARNKIGLNIIYKDKTVDYLGLSGGEKTRINLPLCFGLNKFISLKYGIENGLLGLIVLDEIFANLDHNGEEDVANFLNKEAKDKFVGVITHSDELQSYSNKVWEIEKVNDVTHLVEI